MSDDNITYIMGYWKLPGNKKNNLKHYRVYLPRTLHTLKHKSLVLFYENDDILEYIQHFSKNINLKPIKIDICDLPAFNITESYVESCKNQNNQQLVGKQDTKGLTHYWRDFRGSGHDIYRKLITIWMSKVFLIERIIQQNPFNTENFAWIDASLSRTNLNINNYIFNPIKINANISGMWYKGKKIYNGAGFMISSHTTWLIFIDLYRQKLEALKDSNYAHDEETIIFNIYMDNPSLFRHVLKKKSCPVGKCIEPSCNFLKHANNNNNGGTHCCYSCKRKTGNHGGLCAKILFVI
jgi:hypothetical protein